MVEVIDSTGKNASKGLTLAIASPPTITTATLASGTVNTGYSATLQGTGGTPPYTWALASGALPAGVALSPTNGLISGTPSGSGIYNFNIQMTDSHGLTAGQLFALTIVAALNINAANLPNGTTGVPFSTTFTATGGWTPYSWSVISGQLPPGLSLNSTSGLVSGTPTAQGNYTLGIQVSDAKGYTASGLFSVLIAAGICASCGSPLSITTTSLPGGTVNVGYSANLAATGGTAPYTWSIPSGQLPAGINLASSGTLSGTPTTAGSFAITLQVADSAGHQTSQGYQLTISTKSMLDQYGGRTDIACSGGTQPHFYTEKIGNRWWLCTPSGNAFFMQSLYLVSRPTNLAGKYGTVTNWANAAINRILSWNFNTIDAISDQSTWPINPYLQPAPTTAMPFITYDYPALHTMQMKPGSNFVGANTPYPVDHATKNIWAAMPPNFYTTTYAPEIADFYDPAIATYLTALFATNPVWTAFSGSPQNGYLLGIAMEDGDELYAFSGYGTNYQPTHLGWNVLAASPVQTAGTTNWGSTQSWNGSAQQFLYYDNQLKSKAQLAAYLLSEYGTIDALNAAWGSNYTSFGTSGTDVSSETVAAPNGSSSYTYTLAHLPDMYSVGIYVDGQLVAGNMAHDAGGGGADPRVTTDGRIWGPFVTGTITYGTGALSLTLSTTTSTSGGITKLTTNGSTVTVNTLWQHGLWPGAHISISGTTNYNGSYTVASVVDSEHFTVSKSGSFAEEDNAGTVALTALPNTGDTLTVNYRYNGWGTGTGLLDERANHSWSNTDVSMVNLTSLPSAQMQIDLDNFLQQLAGKFFSDCRTAIKSYMPGILYLGPDAISTHGYPSRAPVLKAAAQYIDVMTTSYGPPFTQSGLDYLYTYYGDKPLFDSFYTTANADSQYAGTQDNDNTYFFPTHTAMGQGYYNRVSGDLSATYTANGSHPFVGMGWWGYSDGNAAPANSAWGLVTLLDNAYDGREDVTTTVTCSAPLTSLTCGGDTGNYTDAVTNTRSANQLWMTIPQ